MLTVDQLINLFSEANRTLFLGKDLHDKCVRDGRKVSKKVLEKRLDFWKSNRQFSSIFKNCGLNDVVRICNFTSPSTITEDDLSNKCYNDIYTVYTQQQEQLQSVNNCSICLEYTKNGEVPNKIGCGHSFHYSCLNEWIKQGHKNCPECRQPITMLSALPSQTTVELFSTMKDLDHTFKKRYLKEMKMFMSAAEIHAFQEIFGVIEDIEDQGYTKTTGVIMFLILSFIYMLIGKGSAYISSYLDPNYVPMLQREDTQIEMPMDWVDTAIMVPTTLTFAALMLVNFKLVLDKIRSSN